MLAGYTPHPVVVVADRATSSWRRRMIERGIPFAVPGNQLYLPMIAIDLREWFRPPSREQGRLSPSAQAVFLWTMLHDAAAPSTPTATGRELSYSTMTVSRALDQLEEFDLVRMSRSGRERLFSIDENRRDLWARAQPVLSSPVMRQTWIRIDKADGAPLHAMSAGLTALSALSMIAQPPLQVLAMERGALHDLIQKGSVSRVDAEEDARALMQIWSYSPHLLSAAEHVDPLSLSLSLREDPDERVQEALHEAMGGLTWW
jgi:DNA-binding MarR family transcriptional regulator